MRQSCRWPECPAWARRCGYCTSHHRRILDGEVPFHRHEDLLAEFPKKGGVGGCGHHEHDGMARHYHYVSGDRIDWRDARGKDHTVKA